MSTTLKEQLAKRKEINLKKKALKGVTFKGSDEYRKAEKERRKKHGKHMKEFWKYYRDPELEHKETHLGLTSKEVALAEEKGIDWRNLPKNKDGTVNKRYITSGPSKETYPKNSFKKMKTRLRREGLPEKAEHTKNTQPITIKNPKGAGVAPEEFNLDKAAKVGNDIINTAKHVKALVELHEVPGYYDTKYSPDAKLHAVVSWLVTGSIAKAARYSAVPAHTISKWKLSSEWWPILAKQVQQARAEQLDSALSDVIHDSVKIIADRLQDGDYKYNAKLDKIVRVPVQAREASTILDKTISNRNLLRGDPTSRTENQSVAENLAELKKAFKDFTNIKTIEGEVVDGSDS